MSLLGWLGDTQIVGSLQAEVLVHKPISTKHSTTCQARQTALRYTNYEV